MEDYKIKIDAFEGPMDLLMHLIEKNKIDIYDIPIAELTRQYLDYLDKFREFNMDVITTVPNVSYKVYTTKDGVIDVEQQALTGGDVKTLLDDLQAKIAG